MTRSPASTTKPARDPSLLADPAVPPIFTPGTDTQLGCLTGTLWSVVWLSIMAMVISVLAYLNTHGDPGAGWALLGGLLFFVLAIAALAIVRTLLLATGKVLKAVEAQPAATAEALRKVAKGKGE
jgi:hypothetical protein